MAKIAVLGHGVVGSGVVELTLTNQDFIKNKAGEKVEVKRILDIRDFPELDYAGLFTKDFQDILNDSEISVVVETMGGLSPAYEFVKQAMEHGKSVVTSNKELVAEKGAELLKITKEHNVNFYFEASVGGGIPIIRPLHMCLAANEIYEIAGILNGTTNFILTKMIHEQMDFDTALKLAQDLGYAEKDPSADVDGHDTLRKICILASLAFGKHVYPKQVHTEGIRNIKLEDVEYAENWGGVIKLIGRAKKLEDGNLIVVTGPALIANQSQLASIEDVFNGILVRGDATGDVVFYGKGAGKMPTASAVIADVIDVVKHVRTSYSQSWEDSADENYVVDYKNVPVSFFVKCNSSGKEPINNTFGSVQFLSRNNAPEHEIAFVTEPMTEYRLEQLLTESGVETLAKIQVLDY